MAVGGHEAETVHPGATPGLSPHPPGVAPCPQQASADPGKGSTAFHISRRSLTFCVLVWLCGEAARPRRGGPVGKARKKQVRTLRFVPQIR